MISALSMIQPGKELEWKWKNVLIPIACVRDEALLQIAEDAELMEDLFGEEDTTSPEFKNKLAELSK